MTQEEKMAEALKEARSLLIMAGSEDPFTSGYVFTLKRQEVIDKINQALEQP